MLHALTHSVTDNQPVWPSFLYIFVKLCFLEPENKRDTEWLFHEKVSWLVMFGEYYK